MISLFPTRNPFEITNIVNDPQGGEIAYHFDAVVRYRMHATTTYTSYPIEFGANPGDHAFLNPVSLTMYGYQGSRELLISKNVKRGLAELGASAVVGNINNPVLSAAAGIGASFLAGAGGHRGATALELLQKLRESFSRFDVQTGLVLIKGLKIDSIFTDVTPENETGLEFVVQMSQLFEVGGPEIGAFTARQIEEADPAQLQAAAVVNRGRVSLGA